MRNESLQTMLARRVRGKLKRPKCASLQSSHSGSVLHASSRAGGQLCSVGSQPCKGQGLCSPLTN